MARIDIRDENLIVTIEGWHKVLALKHKLEVPLSNISGVRVRPDMPHFHDPDFRGTYVPGKVIAGMSVRTEDGVVFCDVEDPSKAVAVDLIDGELKHLIFEVRNATPEEVAHRIEAARRGVDEDDLEDDVLERAPTPGRPTAH